MVTCKIIFTDSLNQSQLSLAVRTIVLVYHAIGVTPFLVGWYVEKLQLQVDFDVTDNSTNHIARTPDFQYLQNSFRNIVSLLFMLHARDQLSHHVREYQSFKMSKDFDPSKQEPLKSAVVKALRWAALLSTFESSKSLELADIALCLAADVPVCEEAVDLVAEVVASCDERNVSKVQERVRVWESKLRQTLDDNDQPFTVRFAEKRAEFKLSSRFDAFALSGSEDELSSVLTAEHRHEPCAEYKAFASQFLTIVHSKHQDCKASVAQKKKSKVSSDAQSLLVLGNRNFYGRTQMSDLTHEVAFEKKHSSFLEKCPEKLQKKVKRLAPYAKWLVNWSAKALAFSSCGASSLPATIRVKVTGEKLLIGLCFAELRSFDWCKESKNRKLADADKFAENKEDEINKTEIRSNDGEALEENKENVSCETTTVLNNSEVLGENKENIMLETIKNISSEEVLDENKENAKSLSTEKDEITQVSSILTVIFIILKSFVSF